MFCLVGGIGILVDTAVLFVLADPRSFGWELSISKVVAAEIALVNNFIWNDLWTFRDTLDQCRRRTFVSRFLRFNLICLAGIGINVLAINAQVHFAGINIYVANFIAVFFVSFWNFYMNLKFGSFKLLGPRPNTALSAADTKEISS